MDPKKIFIGIFFTVFLTVEIFGGDKPPQNCLLFSLTSGSKARLGVVNTSKESLNLEIASSNGVVYFSKSVAGEKNYFQIIDLSKMNDGEYDVKLTGPDQNIKKKFEVKNNMARLIIKEKEVDPVFHLINNETLAISYPNVNNKTISIYFELNNEVVFEEREIKGTQLSKKYSLKKLPKGEYSVKLNSDGKLFSYPVVIK
jgi:hypothetical protein